jgi:poly(A) polymerase
VNALMGYLDDLEAPVYLSKFSALDTYFGVAGTERMLASTAGSLIDLAKAFPAIEFPGIDGMDARLRTDQGEILFTCYDSARPPVHPLPVLNLHYDYRNRKFIDPYEVYWDVRGQFVHIGDAGALTWQHVADAAVLLSRYRYRFSEEHAVPTVDDETPLSAESQRLVLELLLTGKNPKAGFLLLDQTGFIRQHWPELDRMNGTTHSKSHHPEGNVWEHTLETFGYRKTQDLALSLGLLFHDAGKPFARPSEGRMFDGHAEIGAAIAQSFLARLGFRQPLVDDVKFLVRQHMLPPFLPKLATHRTEHVMASPLFPLLLELYRCDISATYRGPEGYYEACKVYRRYLKNAKNPFRRSDGKKLLRLYVEPS